MNQALFVRKLTGFRGDAELFKLVPPMNHVHWDDSVEVVEYVVVSAVVIPAFASILKASCETKAFQCDETGRVTDWSELAGIDGALDIDGVVVQMGYEVVRNLLEDKQ